MKLRALVLTFALLLASASVAFGHLLAQEESTQPSQSRQTHTEEAAEQQDQTEPGQASTQQETQRPDQASLPNQTAPPEQSSPGPSQATPPPSETTPPQSQAGAALKTTTPSGRTGSPPKPPVLRHKRRIVRRKTSSDTPQQTTAGSSTEKSGTEPSKIVVRNGGAKDESAQLAPAVAPAQAQHERTSTAQLLAVTDANLKKAAARQLTQSEQGTLGEIRTYVRQAKAASAAGDTNRAQTLAYKARLLSDELAHK